MFLSKQEKVKRIIKFTNVIGGIDREQVMKLTDCTDQSAGAFLSYLSTTKLKKLKGLEDYIPKTSKYDVYENKQRALGWALINSGIDLTLDNDTDTFEKTSFPFDLWVVKEFDSYLFTYIDSDMIKKIKTVQDAYNNRIITEVGNPDVVVFVVTSNALADEILDMNLAFEFKVAYVKDLATGETEFLAN